MHRQRDRQTDRQTLKLVALAPLSEKHLQVLAKLVGRERVDLRVQQPAGRDREDRVRSGVTTSSIARRTI
jgi:hypothetical protein